MNEERLVFTDLAEAQREADQRMTGRDLDVALRENADVIEEWRANGSGHWYDLAVPIVAEVYFRNEQGEEMRMTGTAKVGRTS